MLNKISFLKTEFSGVLSIFILFFSLLLSGCSGKKEGDQKNKIVTAEKRIIATNLYYSGGIEPIQLQAIVSPVEGIVKKLDFEYGHVVEEGEPLVAIYSRQLQDTYRNTLTTYLTAKRTYLESLTSFEGTMVLHEKKIVSNEDYKNEKSRVDSNRLAYINALYNLEQALVDIPGQKIPEFRANIEKLSFTEMKKIENFLDRKMDAVIISAPNAGVTLLPKKDDGEAGDKGIYEGASVKKGQNLLSLGDLRGIAISVKVNEIDINRVMPGQKVEVTVPALPGEVFKGEIKSISSQARSDNRSGGLATFPAKVVVNELTPKQRKLIRIGMSAKISVNIQSQPQLVIPVEAVFDKDGNDMVVVIDKSGKEKNVRVVVGKTNPEGISIISGLKEGDKILVRD